jgi:uncharacterized protein YybS (DUF2232 family)
MILGIAVFSLTLLFVTLIPFLGPIAVIMTPLPILYHYSRLGRVKGLTALAIALGAVYVILGLLGQRINIVILSTIALTGLILAEILRWRLSIEKTFLLASLALFFSGAGFIAYLALRTGTSPWSVLELYVAGIIRENLKLYEQMNFSPDQVALIRENSRGITEFVTGIFPALAFSGAVITVWLNVLAGRLLFREKGIPFPDFGDWGTWKAPERLVWLLIASGAAVLAPWESLDVIGLNILILCCLVYFFQGLSIATFFFRVKRIPRIMRGLFYLLILVQQYMVVFVVALGLFDIWVDFRKRITGITDVHA